MSWTQEKVQETAKLLQEKAACDASFRASLKENPNAAIEEIAGIQVPAGFKINIADANEADLTIALPKTQNDELSDSDLEAVAGGKWTDDVGDAVSGTVDDIGGAFTEVGDALSKAGDAVTIAGEDTVDFFTGLVK